MKSVLFLLALIFVAGCVQQTTTTAPATTVPTTVQATTTVATTVPANATTTTILTSKEVTANITAAGFSPSTVEISRGDTVTWINRGTAPSWPASAFHPTHAVYPEGGGCIGSKFDACKGLSAGEKFSFAFNQTGTWAYHDHLNPSFTGKVVVR